MSFVKPDALHWFSFLAYVLNYKKMDNIKKNDFIHNKHLLKMTDVSYQNACPKTLGVASLATSKTLFRYNKKI